MIRILSLRAESLVLLALLNLGLHLLFLMQVDRVFIQFVRFSIVVES